MGICRENEQRALETLKKEVDDPSNILSSWVVGKDCCEWEGVLCNNLTRHVIELSIYSDWSNFLSVGLRNTSSLSTLGLGYNKLTGALPESVGQLSMLEFFFIDNNRLEGVVTESHFSKLTQLQLFSASRNNLTLKVSKNWIPPFQATDIVIGGWNIGPLFPMWLRTQKRIMNVDISDGGIQGEVPTWFWNLSSQIRFLNLSHNQFVGEVPIISTPSWTDEHEGPWTIYLGSNNFSGPLPLISTIVTELDLSNNSFSKGLSNFLCETKNGSYKLEILNLGGNDLSEEIPDCWMNWPKLTVLILRDNNLIGSLPRSMEVLRVLIESAMVTTKGNMYQYDTILALFTSMDMSSNNLSGDIPISITRLAGLRSFNLSKNNLTGRIPNDIGDMKVLESVDLSENQLYGQIPQSFSSLTTLSYLNLSDNNLSGMIPLSTQLQSFISTSFQGNKLCGLPLLVNCSSDDNIPNHEYEVDESDKDEVDWFYISMAIGFALSFWGVCGSLLFKRSWRHAYFRFLDCSWKMLLAKLPIC
ncbi:receptor-like protein EIX1 [Solanum verrucosum]|uniref:receptor-like protein EIX1 n=1 Tax=Solanum verrucosum TaxID=315347 RepID=UPI0020D09758|nr:receptor-like protein EIX1 [Solanum verrucosum]